MSSGWLKSAFYRVAGIVPPPLIRMGAAARARYPWLKRSLDGFRDLLRNQEGVIKHGVAKGLLFNTGSSNVGFLLGSVEPEVQKVFLMLIRPGSVIYDIGANVGFFSLVAGRLTGPSGRVVSFEPLAENFQLLERNARRNDFKHIEAKNIAVADHDGSALFLISENATFGGLASAPVRTGKEAGQTHVAVRRLDSVVEESSMRLPQLMKIDVEGAEAAVLDGAMDTIQKARPVLIIELHATNDAISERLKALHYLPVVLGSSKPMNEAHWNAHVIAFPAPCAELTRIQNGDLG